jgi:hypothetical protein
MLLCAQSGDCSTVSQEDLTRVFFVAPNYCLASYCPELERLHENSNSLTTLENELGNLKNEIEELQTLIPVFPPSNITASTADIDSLRNYTENLQQRLTNLERQVANLNMTGTPGVETEKSTLNLRELIENNTALIESLFNQLEILESVVQENTANIERLTSEIREMQPTLAELEQKLRKLHVPQFLGLFSTEPEIVVEAGKCQLLEITVDVLYETYPYFGGTTYVIVKVNDEPVYNGSNDCDKPMNPAAVTDYTFGAPSRTFYIDETDLLANEIVVSYHVCLSHVSEIQPHLTVKCFQAY